jgi:hypothetical protein
MQLFLKKEEFAAKNKQTEDCVDDEEVDNKTFTLKTLLECMIIIKQCNRVCSTITI